MFYIYLFEFIKYDPPSIRILKTVCKLVLCDSAIHNSGRFEKLQNHAYLVIIRFMGYDIDFRTLFGGRSQWLWSHKGIEFLKIPFT